MYKYCCNLRNSLTGVREQVGRQQRRKLHSRLEMTIFTKFLRFLKLYEGWNFNSGNYLFTTDTK